MFYDVEKEMRGLEWGRLYEEYHHKPYNPSKISVEVHNLYGDPYIKNRKGIFEYILGGSKDAKLLDVRVFDEATKRSAYANYRGRGESAKSQNGPHTHTHFVLVCPSDMTPTSQDLEI